MLRTRWVAGLLTLSFLAGMGVQAALPPAAAAPKAPGWAVGCSPAPPVVVTPLTEAPTVVIPATLIVPPPTALPPSK